MTEQPETWTRLQVHGTWFAARDLDARRVWKRVSWRQAHPFTGEPLERDALEITPDALSTLPRIRNPFLCSQLVAALFGLDGLRVVASRDIDTVYSVPPEALEKLSAMNGDGVRLAEEWRQRVRMLIVDRYGTTCDLSSLTPELASELLQLARRARADGGTIWGLERDDAAPPPSLRYAIPLDPSRSERQERNARARRSALVELVDQPDGAIWHAAKLRAIDKHRACRGAECLLLSIAVLEAAVQSGGFESYFFYDGADQFYETLAVLEQLGATRVAWVLERAGEVFPGRVPQDIDERQNFISEERGEDARKAAWHKLDSFFYDALSTEELIAAAARFVREHVRELDLPPSAD
jgi:hypothetical protein